MEVDGVQRTVRGQVTPIYTVDTKNDKLCNPSSTEGMPEITQMTIRFMEAGCKGIPLPHVLGQCQIRVINNYGLCSSSGRATDGWSDYSEIIDAIVISENRGKRSSYDGSDNFLNNELTCNLVKILDIGKMTFTRIKIDSLISTDNFNSNSAVFGCKRGCGKTVCQCTESCDDGTKSIYIGGSSNADSNQYVLYSGDGGETVSMYSVPATVSTTKDTSPKVEVFNNKIYMLGWQNPAELFSSKLDNAGVPSNDFLQTGVDFSANGTVLGTRPLAMIAGTNYLNILVRTAVNGVQYYRVDKSNNASRLFSFPVGTSIQRMAACGSSVAVSGNSGTLYLSRDEGASWSVITTPTSSQISAVSFQGNRIWIGDAIGRRWFSDNSGTSWTAVSLGVSPAVTDIKFDGDIGWTANTSISPFSTWLGGENATDWASGSPRIGNWPSTLNVTDFVIPSCADDTVKANTVMALCRYGGNGFNETFVVIGRTSIGFGFNQENERID
jgi:hypothetical protein